ncbi:hypothetical protein OBBRIDRAFT_546983 [Obba rivulosa]|uniref:Alcohol dehydrogenase-like N-terminal domain-containing protein n=1 Tax=Obba rivulosa TaxID=1052685 RepID=A0A8E2B2T6_9APHY|nr:hypothetical protein OBBRIDRAFT_546983 [Obba rivulosa]
MVPIGFGHEFSGTIVALSDDIDRSRFCIGQNVAIDSLITCKRSDCDACTNGPRNVCPLVTAVVNFVKPMCVLILSGICLRGSAVGAGGWPNT